MLWKFNYMTGQAVWIAAEHIVSVRQSDNPECTIIRTDDGEQFAVQGDAAVIVANVHAGLVSR